MNIWFFHIFYMSIIFLRLHDFFTCIYMNFNSMQVYDFISLYMSSIYLQLVTFHIYFYKHYQYVNV